MVLQLARSIGRAGRFLHAHGNDGIRRRRRFHVLDVIELDARGDLVDASHELDVDDFTDGELVQRAKEIAGIVDRVPGELDDDVAQNESSTLVARGAAHAGAVGGTAGARVENQYACLLYTSPSPRDS